MKFQLQVLQTKSSNDDQKIKEMTNELHVLRQKLQETSQKRLIDKGNIFEYEMYEKERDQKFAEMERQLFNLRKFNNELLNQQRFTLPKLVSESFSHQTIKPQQAD